jgi:hypothetical protein
MAAFMLEVDTDTHFVLVDVVVLRVGTCRSKTTDV